MRLFPTWLHSFLAKTLPSIWKGHGYIRKAQKLLVPEILRRRELMALKELDKSTKDTLLSWMMECAQGSDSDPNHLAHLEIVRHFSVLFSANGDDHWVTFPKHTLLFNLVMLRKHILWIRT